ncbi:MAG: PEGA domain-containing protein [Spirochaetales bacterium]|nr:PEGA domain-containing protein [Spirochaetales bacterium]
MRNKLGLVLLSILFILSNCSTFPKPSSTNESLLVIICHKSAQQTEADQNTQIPGLQFSGPMTAAVELQSAEWGIKTVKLEAGSYQVQLAENAANPIIKQYEIKPQAVILFPYSFTIADNGKVSYLRVTADEQQKAVQLLLNHIDFEPWVGNGYIGFGKARPKMYLSQNSRSITINSDPAGASIFIDNIDWGTTPKKIELSAGKYLLRLEKEGFKPLKRIISVENNNQEYYTLEPLSTETKVIKKDTYSIMVFPFVNIQDENYNPYGNIFLNTFNTNFIKDKELRVIQVAGMGNPGRADYPDLKLAAKNGAELVVAGRYQESKEKLFVHALLYDVQSERVKYAVIYISEAGFSVFDSIDDISLNFSREVSRVLPKPGNPILEQEGNVSAELSAYEKQVFMNRIISKRCSWPHVLSINAGIQMVGDQIQTPSSSEEELRNTPRTPINSLKIEYEYIFSPFLSLSAGLGAHVGSCSAGDEDVFAIDFHATVGPRIYFRSSKSDIYAGILLSATYAPVMTITDMGVDYDYGPYFYASALINAGIKFYFSSLISDKPFYLDTGITFDAVTLNFEESGEISYIPLNMMLYIGLGWHL